MSPMAIILIGFAICLALPILAAGLLLLYIVCNYFGIVSRIFEERPIFVIPQGKPIEGAQDVRIPTTGGLELQGSYLETTAPERTGVILFGTEFGSNRWSCQLYCDDLRASGFDVFTFEFRNHGDSDTQRNYQPLQWVTNHELADMRAAIDYLRGREDAPKDGIGVFGISRGGGAAICAAARDEWVRCIATDGAFSTTATMAPYMRKWVTIYSTRLRLQRWLPGWFYELIAVVIVRRIGKNRGCRFLSLRRAIARIAPRPLLMIHGKCDSYIKPESARDLFSRARNPKEFWLVDGAKHNQAIHVANEAYTQRIRQFFSAHLAKNRCNEVISTHPVTTTPQPVAVS